MYVSKQIVIHTLFFFSTFAKRKKLLIDIIVYTCIAMYSMMLLQIAKRYLERLVPVLQTSNEQLRAPFASNMFKTYISGKQRLLKKQCQSKDSLIHYFIHTHTFFSKKNNCLGSRQQFLVLDNKLNCSLKVRTLQIDCFND